MTTSEHTSVPPEPPHQSIEMELSPAARQITSAASRYSSADFPAPEGVANSDRALDHEPAQERKTFNLLDHCTGRERRAALHATIQHPHCRAPPFRRTLVRCEELETRPNPARQTLPQFRPCQLRALFMEAELQVRVASLQKPLHSQPWRWQTERCDKPTPVQLRCASRCPNPCCRHACTCTLPCASLPHLTLRSTHSPVQGT